MSYTTDERQEIIRLHNVCRQKDEMLKRIADAGELAVKLLHHEGFINVTGGIVESLDHAIEEARETIG